MMTGLAENKFCVTIERGLGSGGKTIGTILAARLGVEYYDRDLSKLSSEYSGIDERLFVKFDETVKNRLFRPFSKADLDAILSPDDENFVSDNNLFRLQAKVINDLANRENCIIIGRCSGYVLRGKANLLRVYVHAPLANCVENVRDRFGVSVAEARRLIAKTDANRRKYYKYYTGLEWSESHNYDLTINTADLSFEQAADLVMAAMRLRGMCE